MVNAASDDPSLVRRTPSGQSFSDFKVDMLSAKLFTSFELFFDMMVHNYHHSLHQARQKDGYQIH